MNTDRKIHIIKGDLDNMEHAEQFLRLTSAYMADLMGGADPWTDQQKVDVIQEMKQNPCALVLFAKADDKIVGICTCFYAYSTFLAKPLLNIHDIFVDEQYRGMGIAKKLIGSVDQEAVNKNCGKITLEVRRDNLNARDLYKNQGFTEAPHSMFFWIKHL